MLFAHFNRLNVEDANLRADKELVVAKACHLALGLLQIALARQWLQTANHCISLIQYLVQAVYENPSPLLQLPYIDAQIVKYARSRKTPIRSVRQLTEMPEDDCRSLLRTLSNDQYKTVIAIAKKVPEVYIESARFVSTIYMLLSVVIPCLFFRSIGSRICYSWWLDYRQGETADCLCR